jgi:hypothetical protein
MDIHHILPDGGIEAQAATERRLVERAGAAALPLFEGSSETADRRALERAYDAWWQRARLIPWTVTRSTAGVTSAGCDQGGSRRRGRRGCP